MYFSIFSSQHFFLLPTFHKTYTMLVIIILPQISHGCYLQNRSFYFGQRKVSLTDTFLLARFNFYSLLSCAVFIILYIIRIFSANETMPVTYISVRIMPCECNGIYHKSLSNHNHYECNYGYYLLICVCTLTYTVTAQTNVSVITFSIAMSLTLLQSIGCLLLENDKHLQRSCLAMYSSNNTLQISSTCSSFHNTALHNIYLCNLSLSFINNYYHNFFLLQFYNLMH